VSRKGTVALTEPDGSQVKAINLSYGDIDLLFAEIKDHTHDLHLLMHILRRLNSAPRDADSNVDAKPRYSFFNLQQLLAAIRHEYNTIILERNQVFTYLTQDRVGVRLLLSEGVPVRVTMGEVVTFIRASGCTPHTARFLRGLAGTGRSFGSVDGLADAVRDQVQREVQEKWRLLLYLTNGNQSKDASPSNAAAPARTHGLFRHVHVRNLVGGPSAPSNSGVSFTITSDAIDRLFSIARFNTIKYLRALDLTGASFKDMHQLESMLKQMEMKSRVLHFLNSPTCTLFVRRNGQQQQPQELHGHHGIVDFGASSTTPQVTSSIPSQFTGREIEQIWSESQSGLSTLTHLKLLESRIGEHAGHVTYGNVNGGTQRVTRGQYTAFSDLLEDLYHMHQASMHHRKQILTYLLQSSSEVSTSVSEEDHIAAASKDDGSHVAAISYGCHHFFREIDYPFQIAPHHVDELFEGQLFEYEEEKTQDDAAAGGVDSPVAAGSSSASLFLLNSAAVLPLLVRMNNAQHLSFHSWSEFRCVLAAELQKVEEAKLAVLLFLTLQTNLLQESRKKGSKAARLQLSMNDVDTLYARFGLLERGVSVLPLLSLLKSEQEDATDEERELKLAAATAQAAAGARGSTAGEQQLQQVHAPSHSHALSASTHAFFSLDDLGRALLAQHRSSLFYKQKCLFYIKFPKHGNLLCTGPVEEAQPQADSTAVVSLTNSIAMSRSTPTLSFSDVDYLLQSSGMGHPSRSSNWRRRCAPCGSNGTERVVLEHRMRLQHSLCGSTSVSCFDFCATSCKRARASSN
jgi:hypothetical protein